MSVTAIEWKFLYAWSWWQNFLDIMLMSSMSLYVKSIIRIDHNPTRVSINSNYWTEDNFYSTTAGLPNGLSATSLTTPSWTSWSNPYKPPTITGDVPNTSFSVGWEPLRTKSEDGSIPTARCSQSLQVKTAEFRLLKDAFSRLLESSVNEEWFNSDCSQSLQVKNGSTPTA